MKKNVFLLALFLIFLSCSEVTYRTLYQSQTDPVFVFPRTTSIGLTQMFCTKKGKEDGIDELFEKVLLSYFKKNLESRRVSVFYVPLENLKEEEDGNVTAINMEKYPELSLTVSYFQRPEQVNIPTRTSGYLLGQGGAVSSTGAHSVTAYELFIQCTLWSGAPEYRKPVWRASILRGSPIPDLSEQARSMVYYLVLNKFLKN